VCESVLTWVQALWTDACELTGNRALLSQQQHITSLHIKRQLEPWKDRAQTDLLIEVAV